VLNIDLLERMPSGNIQPFYVYETPNTTISPGYEPNDDGDYKMYKTAVVPFAWYANSEGVVNISVTTADRKIKLMERTDSCKYGVNSTAQVIVIDSVNVPAYEEWMEQNEINMKLQGYHHGSKLPIAGTYKVIMVYHGFSGSDAMMTQEFDLVNGRMQIPESPGEEE